MNMMKHLNEAMQYIEDHLCEEINFDHLSRIACCSEYHFRRIFSYVAGMSLSEYIRKRKLSYAAAILQSGNEKIIDIALRLGYESPDAFSKAFQAMHGVSPSHARKDAVMLKTFPPLTFQLTLRGGSEMNYRIVEKGKFYMMGAVGRIPLIYNGPNPHTADVWRKLRQEDLLVLTEYSQIEPRGILNAYTNYEDKHTEGTELDLFVGIAMEDPMPDRFKTRFDVLPVEASTWAVFTTIEKKPFETQETWGRISSEWFPTSGYEMTKGPEILWYESFDFSKPDFKTEIWIPIRKLNG
ncbi:AraC family transcriptional regulator [Paenibacillus albus]|uniref:AraC family transcriptional regulator n=2 Tax=Paenibacillus albus TaxID=2495582 RepID=A0A3Q8X8X5_9BACL|nr:AraC family transcriptional regulator [Paenibacillus albus]